MMKKRNFFYGIFGLVALHATAFADGYSDGCCVPEIIPGEPVCGQFGPIYPQDASVDLEGSCTDMYITADLIYWSTYTFNSVVGFKNRADGRTEELMLKDHYQPGFKLGVGVETCLVNLDLQYVRWHHVQKTNYSAGANESLLPQTFSGFLGLVAVPNYSQLRSRWTTHFDQLYFTMQRPFYLGTRVVTTAAVGLIGQWFKHKTVIDCISEVDGLAPGINGFVEGIHHYWTIGPATGIRGKVLFDYGLRFLANFDLALVYQYYTKGQDTLSFPPVNPFNPFANSVEKYKFHKRFRAITMWGLGLGWESYLCCNRYHANVSVLYEINTNTSNATNFEHFLLSDTYLHGWTVEARFDF